MSDPLTVKFPPKVVALSTDKVLLITQVPLTVKVLFSCVAPVTVKVSLSVVAPEIVPVPSIDVFPLRLIVEVVIVVSEVVELNLLSTNNVGVDILTLVVAVVLIFGAVKV